MKRLVHGIGINDGKYPAFINGVPVDEYTVWMNMLLRCTKKIQDKYPTYKGTTCSENFKSYSYFYKWYHKQFNNGKRDENGKRWQLDKDLLVKGNKIYSEDTCVFVPQRINKLLIKPRQFSGGLPTGVTFKKSRNRYRAQCNIGTGVSKHLGDFKTSDEAFLAYKTFKEAFVKQVANEYKPYLDPRVYKSLMQYEVTLHKP